MISNALQQCNFIFTFPVRYIEWKPRYWEECLPPPTETDKEQWSGSQIKQANWLQSQMHGLRGTFFLHTLALSTCNYSAVNTLCPMSVIAISLTLFELLFIQGNSIHFQKHTSHSSAQTWSSGGDELEWLWSSILVKGWICVWNI